MRISTYQINESKRLNLQNIIDADDSDWQAQAKARAVRAENIRRTALAGRGRTMSDGVPA